MAKTQYRVGSLSERGLLYTLKLECWVNREMPSDLATLARVLGFDAADVAAALCRCCHSLPSKARPDLPELDDYRAHIDGRREALEAGKRARQNEQQAPGTGRPDSHPQPGRGPLVKPSQAKPAKFKQAQYLS